MAREIRDDEVIGKTGVYLNETCNKINTVKSSFISHVESLKSNYVGVDATAISNILINAINRVTELVDTLSYYSDYMLSVAKYDNENIDNASKKIRSQNKLEPVIPIEGIPTVGMEGEMTNESEQIKY